MSAINQLSSILTGLHSKFGDSFEYDMELIGKELSSQKSESTPAVYKVVSIISSLFIVGCIIGIFGLFGIVGGMFSFTILGILFFTSTLILNREIRSFFLESLTLGMFIASYPLIAFGLFEFDHSRYSTSIIFIILSLISLVTLRTYLYNFIAILILNFSFIALFDSELGTFYIIPYIILFCLTIILFLSEADILTGKFKDKINHEAYLMAYVVTVLVLNYGLIYNEEARIMNISIPYWAYSIVHFIGLIYFGYYYSRKKSIDFQWKSSLYILPIILGLIFTYNSPSISGALLIVLLSYYVQHRIAMGLGIFSLLIFVIAYYYMLDITLLTKSIYLLISGALFMIAYYFHSNLNSHASK